MLRGSIVRCGTRQPPMAVQLLHDNTGVVLYEICAGHCSKSIRYCYQIADICFPLR